MTAIMTTSAAVLIKAGANVSSDLTGAGSLGLTADEIVGGFISGAQCLVNAMTRINYNDSYGTLNEDVKYLLKDTVEDFAAIPCIEYDMSGYTSRFEAQGMIDVLRDAGLRGLSLLKDKKVTTFINDA